MAVVLRAIQRLSPFWLAWVAACTASGALIGALSLRASDFHPFLVVSTVFAVPQWLVLRGRIDNAWLWIPVTGVIGTLAWMIASPLSAVIYLLPFLYPLAFLLGAMIGLFQWAVLHRAYPSSALVPWLVASALGTLCLVQACVDLVLASTLPEYRTLVPGTVGGAAYGVLTGAVLYREARRPELISE